MAPRQNNQEGDAPAGFVEEQVANIELGQVAEAVAGNNVGGEILPTETSSEVMGEAVGILRRMMEENHKLVAQKRRATKEDHEFTNLNEFGSK
ncbi:unnamed protein product [Linum trigynum]|uniref:Uncharacterized protein n=1 Tax=Linum trigynum TaxID=586398 RepID=A0AAV2FN18_9ROSI